MIGHERHHRVLGSRILGGHAVQNGMPWLRSVANRPLTLFSNVLMRAKLPEFHTGGCVATAVAFRLARMGLVRLPLSPKH